VPYIGTLSALLNFAVREELLAVNVASRVRLPRAALTDDYHFLTPDELRSLIAAVVPGEHEALDRALYLTAAMTGLREGELCALRWRDVDWKAAKIRVRRNYVLGEITTPKSRRSQRAVPMPDEVTGELDRLFKASSRQADDDLVFADPSGDDALDDALLNKAAILRRYKRALKAAKLDDGRFHDLRHTYGTEMAAAGVPMRTLQEWMGHASIKTTERYADFAPNRHEADLVAKAFKPERSAAPAALPA
jgi:integrase